MPFLGAIGFIGVGLALGLLGGGGSILAVPVLIHLFHMSAGTAVAMSLPVVGSTALAGAYLRWRRGELRVRTALTFAMFSMPVAFIVARLGAGLQDRPRILLLAATMVTAATFMWMRSLKPTSVAPPSRAADASLGLARVLPTAVAAGTLTGLVGVGGGFLIVPALTGVLGVPIGVATSTALAVIALNTPAAGLGFIGKVSLDWPLTLAVTGLAFVGMAIGTWLAPRVPARTLARIFAAFLLAIGSVMVWQELRS